MIKIAGLDVRYNGRIVLKNISLEMPGDKITCILGPNGAGKTTLLRAISKIIDFKGSIYLDGLEISKTPLKTIARILSYTSHLYINELLSLTVLDTLLISRYPISKGFMESREDYEAVINTAKKLRLGNMLNRKLSELSSGELQRVVIASALVKNPRYLLFDEPDAHIDPGSKNFIARIIRDWSRDHVVVFTTQDILFGLSVGEYFIVINNGEIVFSGEYRELIRSKHILEKAFGLRLFEVEVNNRSLLIPSYSF
ncbi:MAG: ABC transporter [Desulfurococcales archaeon ex4484_58]|nr:MAG: ABC transporter [Desulfurococcales archaeon ex4484_58]